MPVYVDISPTADDLIDEVIRYASLAPPTLQRQLAGLIVNYLVHMGWDPLLAELEVQLRIRQLL